jgi:hypothetical protein
VAAVAVPPHQHVERAGAEVMTEYRVIVVNQVALPRITGHLTPSVAVEIEDVLHHQETLSRSIANL